MKKCFTEEQIVKILREAEVAGLQVLVICRKHNIVEQTFHHWRSEYGGMEVPEARNLKDLESENAKLKRMVTEQLLVIEGLKGFAGKNDRPEGSARGAGLPDPSENIEAFGLSASGIQSARGGI